MWIPSTYFPARVFCYHLNTVQPNWMIIVPQINIESSFPICVISKNGLISTLIFTDKENPYTTHLFQHATRNIHRNTSLIIIKTCCYKKCKTEKRERSKNGRSIDFRCFLPCHHVNFMNNYTISCMKSP